MKITFIHYHLRPGGVTSVIGRQVEAVEEGNQALIITGELPGSRKTAETVLVPELAYDKGRPSPCDPKETASKILKAIHTKWHTGCDLLHVHNPLLAKNRHLIKVVNELQNQGVRIFLQIHDFAEDGRPDVYYDDEYPANCHYGVINRRDYHALLKSGLNKAGLHILHNPVQPMQLCPVDAGRMNQVLYPVRAIRRKNLGEAILLSLFFRGDAKLVVTLPPNSALDRQIHAAWKAFAGRNKLNVEFDAGLSKDLPSLIQASDFILTTSISEGFGFSFVEPWAAGKRLWGRRIDAICRDFEDKGLHFEHMYSRLDCPVEWIEEDLLAAWHGSLCKAHRRYRKHLDFDGNPADRLPNTADGLVDFGLLNEKHQKAVISLVLRDKDCRRRLIRLNPFLADPGRIENSEALIMTNQKAIAGSFSMEQYKRDLMSVYSAAIHTPICHEIDKKKLYSEFLDLSGSSLLKWGDYEE